MRLVHEKLNHALPSLLLSAGWLLPLLGVLHPAFADPMVLLWAAAVVLLFELFSLRRWTSLLSAGIIAAGFLIWLAAFGGISILQDVFIALSLRASGQTAALPLIASPVVTLFSILVPLLACFSMLRKASYLPSILLTIAVTMLVWLADRMELLPWLLPAFAAVLLRLMEDHSEGMDPLRTLPFAAALIALAFFLTPRGGVSDPTLKEKADDLRQSVMDRLFFTEPRDVFSLSSEGYYPEGAHQLGGTPELSDREVMQVSAPRTVYLRGVILNDYNGRCWTNTTGGRRYLWQSARLEESRVRIFDQNLPAESVRNAQCEPMTVSVRMLSDNASTLFVPQRIRSLDPGGELVPYYSNASEVFVTRNLQAGDTWSVSSPLFQAGDSGIGRLIEASASFPDSGYNAILETYTALPAHLEQPVYDLAKEASSAGYTPYEKALAIQSWLSRSFRYTLEVADQPENIDFVTNFLLNTKEGYCTYFASAMTVLCRMVGLPARYVEGYLAEPDASGTALVTGRSGHAWTEVYFSGFGWLTFDATPRHSNPGGSEMPSSSPEPSSEPEETPTPKPEQEPEPSPEPSEMPEDDPTPTPEPDPPTPSPEPPQVTNPPDVPSDSHTPVLFWLWLLLALLVLAALILRILFSSPVLRDRRASSENARFEVWAQELSDLLRAEGLTRRKGETPMAFARRIDASPRFSASLSPCGECISLIHYSRVHPLPSDTALLRGTAVSLKKELSAPARLRYFLRRIFLPLSRRDYAKTGT